MRCLLAIAATVMLIQATAQGASVSSSAAFLKPATNASSDATVCWKNTVDRGVGVPISACANPEYPEMDAGLCYEKCKDATPSYYGVGPVCWQHCLPGFVDEGALCRKDGSIYTYAKKSYGRGVGTPMTCKPSQVYDAGLCYPPCQKNMSGVGPVCWADCDATPDPVSGGAICCRNGDICTDKLRDLVGGLPLAIMHALLSGGNSTKIEESAMQAVESVLGFVMPLCNQM